jgi:hypothetical protein
MRIDSRILDPVSTVDGPEIVGSIGSQVDRQAERAAGGNQRVGSSAQEKLSTAVGGTESASLRTRSTTRRLTIDPITGKEMDVIVKVRRVSESHGEEVLTTVTRTAKSDKDSK